LLARGGMGVVYHARDQILGRRVALKVISPELAADHHFRQRFRRESRLAAQVEHPHVVPVYRAGQDHGRLYLAMRFVEGTDLSRELYERMRLPATEAVRIVGDVASALDAAHARGLVHRDVKPANVLIAANDGQAFLTDFGLTVQRDTGSTLTGSGRWIGTPAYAAPEQLRGGAVDARTDVYALGGVLYHCLTGQVPFPAANDVDLLSAHLFDPPPRPSRLDPGLPSALDAVVERAMAKAPAARFCSAGEFAMAAQSAVVGAPDAAPREVTDALQVTPGGRIGRLPIPMTPLVGRSADIARLSAMLRDGDVRMVTLTGPGGIGKTRLALEVARNVLPAFTDGACFVDLAPVLDAVSVEAAIADVLGVPPAGNATVDDGLVAALASRDQLLLVDNFEHLLEAGECISRLLAAAPALKILVTSRAPLRLLPEHEYRVPPLPVADAVALFELRGRAIRQSSHTVRSDATIEKVCSRLEGLPLAIELAAARLRHLTPESMLRRLERRLALLTHGPRDLPDRQRTLRATIKWSHDLLDADEQRLFARLAVFVGGFTIEAAEAVCETELDTLTALVDSSLVLREDGAIDQPRLRMLETIREYATEQLSLRDDHATTQDRHATYHVMLAEQAEPELWGGRGQRDWLRRLRVEDGNLRAALERVDRTGPVEHQLRLTAAIWRLWLLRGDLTEGARRVEAALVHAEAASPDQRWRLLFAAAVIAARLDDIDRASTRAAELQALGRRLGDRRIAGYAAVALAQARRQAAEFEDARMYHQTALDIGQESGDNWLVRMGTANLSDAALSIGDYERAEKLARQGAAMASDHYDDWALATSISNLTFALVLQGRSALAAPLLVEGLLLSERHEFREITTGCLECVAAICATSEPHLAARLLGADDAILDELGMVREPAEQRLHEQTLATLAARLAPDRITASWQLGRRMGSHEAVAAALDALQS
jgi:non-specific serine/threonine protein kinase